jgi:D-tyrosyl-tRNA(Tyr) deacylase
MQRVSQASVSVDGDVVSRIDRGLLLLVGVTHDDTEQTADTLARKVANLRIFEDDAGKMNLSLLDVGGSAIVVSQFTLYASTRRGRRPGFTDAARPELAEPLVARFADALRRAGVADVQSGLFGAHMLVEIHNDGPVTIILDSA